MRIVLGTSFIVAMCITGAVVLGEDSSLLAPSSSLSADVALYERRIREDTWSAADRATLSMLYLQRAREEGDYEDFRRAERVAREALALRADRNRKALLGLASSLLAQHRFVEARDAAKVLVDLDSSNLSSRALYAEILLELGEYDAADRQFTALSSFDENLAVAPRYARWLELHGRTQEARTVLLRAAATARARSDLPREQVAWFYLRVADHALRNGRLREARRAIESGLEVNREDARLLSVLARVRAARREWSEVLALAPRIGERADIATLGLMGDAAAALGREAEARTWFARAEAAYRSNPEPFARQWTEFAVNHGLYRQATIDLLEEELRIRPDMLGHQLLARAYDRAGRPAAADSVMERAWTHFKKPHWQHKSEP